MMRKAFESFWTYLPLAVIGIAYLASAAVVFIHGDREAPADVTVLRIAHWQLESGVRDGLNELAQDYARHRTAKGMPPVRIVQEAIPEGTYGTWVSTQLIGGTAPDILEIGKLPSNLLLAYLKRYFLPLTPYVARPNPYNMGTDLEGVPLKATFKDGMASAYRSEMQEYMWFALAQGSVRLFYNKRLLKRLTGLDQAPTDYRAFLSACERIARQKNARGLPYVPIAGSGVTFGIWDEQVFTPITYRAIEKADLNRDGYVGNDELFVVIKAGMIDFHFRPFAAKFKLIGEITKYFQPGFVGLSRDDSLFLFIQQRAMFFAGGTWDARGLVEQARGKFEVGVCDFPFPGKDDPDYGDVAVGPRYENPINCFPFGVTKMSRNSEAAVDFLLFLAGKQQNEKLNRIIGWRPGIKGAAVDPFLKAFEPRLFGVYGAMDVNLGGETYIKWSQLYSLFQVGQITYDELVAQFEPFYKERGLLDFQEVRRDWRRALIERERFIAGLRAAAMRAGSDGFGQAWVRYRQHATAQIDAENERMDQDELLAQASAAPLRTGPYEYSPALRALMKTNLRRSMRKQRRGE